MLSPIRSLLEAARRRAHAVEPEEGEAEPEPTATEAEPEPVSRPEPEPAPESDPEPMLALAPPPPPPPEPEPESEPAVVPLVLRDQTPRTWNLWELERLAAKLNGDAASEERTMLLLHMREFAPPSGDLPVEFDPLVRDAFGAGLAGLAR
jgi:hypothetical protein